MVDVEETQFHDDLEQLRSPRQRVLFAIRQWIEDGRLRQGDSVPSERNLADQLEVARPTVRAAFEELEQEGLISQQGRRRVVLKSRPMYTSLLTDTVVVFADTPDIVFSPYHTWYINVGALKQLSEEAYTVVSQAPFHLSEQKLDRIINGRPLGVVAYQDVTLPTTPVSVLGRIQDAGIPVVVYGSCEELESFDRVSSDHVSGSYQLTRFLIERGRRHILRFWELDAKTGEYPDWLRCRDEGYASAMSDSGIPAMSPLLAHKMPFYINTKSEFEIQVNYTVGLLARLLGAHPEVDAIMSISDGLVCTLAEACRMFGREDIEIVGYDNLWSTCVEQQWCGFKPVATVDKCNERMGREMVKLLVERINGGVGDRPRHVRVPPEFVLP